MVYKVYVHMHYSVSIF